MSERPLPAPYVTKLDARGRIVIRKEHRKAMGLLNGGRIEWFINEDGRATLRHAAEN